jgi:hypothetical protein
VGRLILKRDIYLQWMQRMPTPRRTYISSLVNAFRSSPSSCRYMQSGLVHVRFRRKYEQYLVVPNDALQRCARGQSRAESLHRKREACLCARVINSPSSFLHTTPNDRQCATLRARV